VFWKKKDKTIGSPELQARLAAETKAINEVEAQRSKAIDAAEQLADKIIDDK